MRDVFDVFHFLLQALGQSCRIAVTKVNAGDKLQVWPVGVRLGPMTLGEIEWPVCNRSDLEGSSMRVGTQKLINQGPANEARCAEDNGVVVGPFAHFECLTQKLLGFRGFMYGKIDAALFKSRRSTSIEWRFLSWSSVIHPS